jgi:NADH dehydrogenase/NADH:ubiquinone oxidoreductase subunit G
LPSRTPAELAENQQQSSYNVSDYVLNANNQLWKETFYKICLLHWVDIVKKEPESKADMINTRFDLKIKMKATDEQKAQLEADIQRYSQMPDAQGNPSITLKDAIMIREIDDYRLACWYLESTFEKNRKKAIQESQMLQEQNQKLQQESAQQAQQQAMALQQEKLANDKQMADDALRRKKEEILLSGIMTMVDSAITAGTELPPEWKPVAAAVIANVTVPLQVENHQQMNAIVAHSVAHNAAMQQAQPPQGAPPDQPQPQMQQPPNQAA